MKKFYIYFHYKKDSGELFYIGKGSGFRAYQKQNRNKFWLNIVNKHNYVVSIVKDNLSNNQALTEEIEFIKLYSPCANFTKGGDGGDTFSFLLESEKTRIRDEARARAFLPNSGVRKAAKIRKNQTKETNSSLALTAEKLSLLMSGVNNPMFGKSHWRDKNVEEAQLIKDKTSNALKKSHSENPRIYKRIICPHCLKIGAITGMTRYHFNNCKKRNNND